MQLTEEQFNEIQDLFPKPRGNVRWGHRRVLNGILYILKHGCPWRSLPACYGRWNTVYVQMRRWAERGVLAAVFECLRDRGSGRIGHRDGDDAGQHLGEGTCGRDG